MAAKQVKITSEDGQEGFVMEESVRAWERHGWTRADDGSSEEAAAPQAPKAAPVQPAAPEQKG
jgi:hypothetical protein